MSNELTQITSTGSRIALFRTEKHLSQQKLADVLGVSRGYIGDIERDRSEPSSNFLTLLASKMDVSIDWILTGKGKMLKKMEYSELSSTAIQTQDQKSSYDFDKNKESWGQFALVPYYGVEASAGSGRLVDQELKISDMAFRTDWLVARGLKPSHCALIKARGDSMEPTINDGDLLLVDTLANSIKDDSIYIVQADHHLVVKRIQQALDGSLIIISDNNRYENQTISADQVDKVKVVGRVRWYGHEI